MSYRRETLVTFFLGVSCCSLQFISGGGGQHEVQANDSARMRQALIDDYEAERFDLLLVRPEGPSLTYQLAETDDPANLTAAIFRALDRHGLSAGVSIATSKDSLSIRGELRVQKIAMEVVLQSENPQTDFQQKPITDVVRDAERLKNGSSVPDYLEHTIRRTQQ